LTDNVAGGSVTNSQLIITVDTSNPGPARPPSDLRLDDVFTNSSPFLCPVTYTHVVDNASSFTDDRSSLFRVDPSDRGRMAFTYDDANPYDGKTIHYKVKALTDANLPLYVTITVVDTSTTCTETTLSFNDANVLAYPTEKYKAIRSTGATLNTIY
jgi:hypothetical protein